jgi:hypothetical protein
MKTVLTSIITSIITVVVALLVVNAIWGGGECMYGDDEHEKACKEQVKKECEKKCESREDAHHMMMGKLQPIRAEFDTQLSDEERATIEAIREKFEDVDHEKMCEEGKKKFYEQHKADIEALLAIAGNHKEFLNGVHAKMHMSAKGHEGEVEKPGCPEAAKCKEATEKCKGEHAEAKPEPKEEAEKKCAKAEAECKAECENTFKIHFLLMDDHDDDEDYDHEEGDDD